MFLTRKLTLSERYSVCLRSRRNVSFNLDFETAFFLCERRDIRQSHLQLVIRNVVRRNNLFFCFSPSLTTLNVTKVFSVYVTTFHSTGRSSFKILSVEPPLFCAFRSDLPYRAIEMRSDRSSKRQRTDFIIKSNSAERGERIAQRFYVQQARSIDVTERLSSPRIRYRRSGSLAPERTCRISGHGKGEREREKTSGKGTDKFAYLIFQQFSSRRRGKQGEGRRWRG